MWPALSGRAVALKALQQDFAAVFGPPAQQNARCRPGTGGSRGEWAGGQRWAKGGPGGRALRLAMQPATAHGAAWLHRHGRRQKGMHRAVQGCRQAASHTTCCSQCRTQRNKAQALLQTQGSQPNTRSRLLHRLLPLLQGEGCHAAGRHSSHSRAKHLATGTPAHLPTCQSESCLPHPSYGTNTAMRRKS